MIDQCTPWGVLAGHGGSNIGWKLEFGLVRAAGVGYTVHTNGESGQGVCDGVRAVFLDWLAGKNGTTAAAAAATGSVVLHKPFAVASKRSVLELLAARVPVRSL